jgi:predicted lactoylglutathione lyase
MKKTIFISLGIVAAFCFGFMIKPSLPVYSDLSTPNQTMENIKLGAFSVSLSVKDLQKSKDFYENLGFTQFAGSMEQNYLIMKNEKTLIGLFKGMFEGNILTFNPGWDENAAELESFDDIRTIQKHLKSKGISLVTEAAEGTSGPASLMVLDPDGNMILLDQHR